MGDIQQQKQSKAFRTVKEKGLVNRTLNWVDGCACAIIDSGKEAMITVSIYDRKAKIKNAKYHAMIGDIVSQCTVKMPGKRIVLREYTDEKAKAILVMWFARECELINEPLANPPETMVNPISGETITIRPSTAEFDGKDKCKFIEWLYATGAELSVSWSEPAMKEWQSYREAQS